MVKSCGNSCPQKKKLSSAHNSVSYSVFKGEIGGKGGKGPKIWKFDFPVDINAAEWYEVDFLEVNLFVRIDGASRWKRILTRSFF